MNKKIIIAVFMLLVFTGIVFAECGNGSCETGENQCSCPSDCGQCSGDYSAAGACKELACVNSVCSVITKSGCCGNEMCESGEDYSGCPADCLPKSVDISLVFPDSNTFFVFGERVNLLVEVLVDNSTKAIGADVTAEGPFKTMKLYNDSQHGDGSAFDAVYGNYFIVTKDMLGQNTMTFTAFFRGLTGTATAELFVSPDLNIVLHVPEEVALGDVIDFSGNVFAKTIPAGMSLDANILFQGQTVFSETFESDSNSGAFSFSYPVSLLSKLGTYALEITGTDAEGNSADFSASFEVMEKVFPKGLKIEVLPLEQEIFSRGNEILLVVNLSDDKGLIVEGAEITVNAFEKQEKMFEFEPGKYSLALNIPFSAPAGENTIQISALKEQGPVTNRAFHEFVVTVEKTTVLAELLSPKEKVFKAGDTINFEVLVSYSNGHAVTNADVFVLIGTEEIQLLQPEPGTYSGNYMLTSEQYDVPVFSVKIVDEYGNVNSLEQEINVSGETFQFFLMRNIFWVLIIVAVVAGALFAVSKFGFTSAAKSKQKSETQKLEEKLEQLQTNYFKKGMISRKQYDVQAREIKTKLRSLKGRKF